MEAILFGSYARGDADPGSDIDVLLLVDASRQDISDRNWQIGDLAAEILLNHGIVVSPPVENREYFNRNLQLFPFYRSIEREGVRISARYHKSGYQCTVFWCGDFLRRYRRIFGAEVSYRI